MTELRPYQHDAIAKLREAFREHRRVLYQLPTGGGKTVVFGWLARTVAERKKRVLILTDRKHLVGQASRKLTEYGVEHGVIDASTKGITRRPVVVASVQTLVRRLEQYEIHFDLVVCDECRLSVAPTWATVLARFPKARVLGVDATPERYDGRGLREQFDFMVCGPSVRELIFDGYLADYVAYRPASGGPDLSEIHVVAGDYNNAELAQLMSGKALVGDAVDHYRRLADGLPALAFCCNVRHAEHVAEQFQAAGYRAYSVDGTMDDATRDARINGLSDGSVQVLTSCQLISYGMDVPAVAAAILLRPTKSLAMCMQQIGRTLRPKPNDGKAIILDHAGNLDEHGMPCQPRDWSLDGRPKKKKKKASLVPITTCFECYATVASSCVNCPHCGAKLREPPPLPEQVSGELVEVLPGWWNGDGGNPGMPRSKAEVNAAARRCQTFEQLKDLGESLGYKRGWAVHQARGMGWKPVFSTSGYPYKYVRRSA